MNELIANSLIADCQLPIADLEDLRLRRKLAFGNKRNRQSAIGNWQ